MRCTGSAAPRLSAPRSRRPPPPRPTDMVRGISSIALATHETRVTTHLSSEIYISHLRCICEGEPVCVWETVD